MEAHWIYFARYLSNSGLTVESLASTSKGEPIEIQLGPSREIYGFVLYVVSWILLVLYLIYAIIPDSILHGWGITYYPQKWWALAIPTYICSLYVFTLVFYVAINMMRTPALDSINTIIDEYTTANRDQNTDLDLERIPPIIDIHIDHVNSILYNT